MGRFLGTFKQPVARKLAVMIDPTSNKIWLRNMVGSGDEFLFILLYAPAVPMFFSPIEKRHEISIDAVYTVRFGKMRRFRPH